MALNDNKIEVELIGKDRSLSTVLNQARSEVGTFGQQISTLQGIVAGFSVAGLITQFGRMTISATRAAIEMTETANRIGLSARELSRWTSVAETTGVSANTISTAMRTMSKTMKDAGDTRSLSQGLMGYIGYLQSIGDEATRNAEALRIFGRAGLDMGGLFRMSADELYTWLQRADQVGATMRGGLVVGATAADGAVDALKQTWSGFQHAMAEALLMQPQMIAFMNAMAVVPTPAPGTFGGSTGWLGPGHYAGSVDLTKIAPPGPAAPGPYVPTILPRPLDMTPMGIAPGFMGATASMREYYRRRSVAAVTDPLSGRPLPLSERDGAAGAFARLGQATPTMIGDAAASFGANLIEVSRHARSFGEGLHTLTQGALRQFGSAVLANVAAILAEKAARAVGGFVRGILGFQHGGIVPFMPGAMPGRDSVPALLTPGERVIPVGQSRMGGGAPIAITVNASPSSTYLDKLRFAYDIREALNSPTLTGHRVAA